MPKTTVAKRRPRRRNNFGRPYRKRRFSLPLAAILGFAPLFANVWGHWKIAGPQGATQEATRIMTGYDLLSGQWKLAYLSYGLFPALAGLLVHKFIGGSLGVNRMLGSAGIPVIRL